MDEEQQQPSPLEVLSLILASDNLALEMDEERLKDIGRDVCRDYDTDKESMADWLADMQAAIKLAKMEKEGKKTYPFDGAANIKYPLIATAAMQFNARAYPAIVPGDGVVKGKTYGKDTQGLKAARSARISAFMSWQKLSQEDEWDESTDKLLYQVAIVGDMFRKVWFNGDRNESRVIEPGKFIVNAKTQTLSKAPRATEEFELYPYQVKERETDGRFREIVYTEEGQDDEQKPREFIEQHCRIDLDGDGYPEPYIATVYVETQKVVRLVPDFEQSDIRFVMTQTMQPVQMDTPFGPQMVMQPVEVPERVKEIRRNSYFVHYQFAPSPDGGFWGRGLGFLLKDISEAIDSTFNMLIDAGHFASLGGGFIGADFRVKGGALNMRPGEWRKMPVAGNDMRSAMVPVTYPGPDQTLFAMLGMLIDAGKEVSSVKDIMTGETSHNMQPTTVMALIEQGLTVFTAVYKRIFRSLKREFSLCAKLNAKYLDPQAYSAFHDEVDPQSGQPMMLDPAQDFDMSDMDIEPVADPQSVTRMQEMAKAELLMQMSQQGLVNPATASRRVLEAASIDNRDELAVPEDPMAPMMAQANMEMLMTSLAQAKADVDLTLARIEGERAKAVKNMADIDADQMRVQIEAFEANMQGLRERREALGLMMENVNRGMDRAVTRERNRVAGTPSNGGGQAGVPRQPRGPEASGLAGLLAGAGGAGIAPGGFDPSGAVPVQPV